VPSLGLIQRKRDATTYASTYSAGR